MGILKVAVTHDFLVQRNYVQQVLECVVGLFESVEIFTLAHSLGRISGHLEQKKIHSTYLSHKMVDEKSIHQYSYLIPQASAGLTIPCSFDLVIHVSSGLGHGISVCSGVPQITYLFDWTLDSTSKVFLRERFFNAYLKSWAWKKMMKSDLIWVANKELQKKLELKGRSSDLVYPPFKLSDYPIVRLDSYNYDYFIVNTQGLSVSLALKIMTYFQDRNIRFKFVGDDTHLNSLKEGNDPKIFFGNRCSGELAPLLAGAKFLIDFSKNVFPQLVLASLACGRPVLRSATDHEDIWELKEGVTYLKNSETDLFEFLNFQISMDIKVNSDKLRASISRFNDIRFRRYFKKKVEAFAFL